MYEGPAVLTTRAATALRLKKHFWTPTQGSSFLATLGFEPESRWDSVADPSRSELGAGKGSSFLLRVVGRVSPLRAARLQQNGAQRTDAPYPPKPSSCPLDLTYLPGVDRITRTRYHVVAGSPTANSQPDSSRRPRIGLPIGRAAPSRGISCIPMAPSISCRVIQPFTGSIKVGGPPLVVQSVRRSFQTAPVFCQREHAVNNIVAARDSGLSSRDDTVTAQKSFFTSADSWLVPMPLAFTKPTSAWERFVSIMTRPLVAPETCHSSSLVSETNGGWPSARKRVVGWQSRHLTREPCCSGSDSGNPGVKYGRSASGRRMLSLICAAE